MYRIPTFLSYTLESAEKKAPAPIRSFGAGKLRLIVLIVSFRCRSCSTWADLVHGSHERLCCGWRTGLEGSAVEGDPFLALAHVVRSRETDRQLSRLSCSSRVRGSFRAHLEHRLDKFR